MGYDLDFEQIGICSSFERELTPHELIPGIKIVRGAVVPPGAVLSLTDSEIKRTMIEYGQQPPAIRILKPVSMPADGEPLNAVQIAIHSVNAEPIAVVQGAALTNGRTFRIEQA